MAKDLTEQYDVLKHQNTKLCKQIENAEEILSQHEAYISSPEKENAKLNERIEKLEELLKECRNVMNIAGYFFGKIENVDKARNLLQQIDEVLNVAED